MGIAQCYRQGVLSTQSQHQDIIGRICHLSRGDLPTPQPLEDATACREGCWGGGEQFQDSQQQ